MLPMLIRRLRTALHRRRRRWRWQHAARSPQAGFGLDYDYQIKSMTTENLEIAEKLWAHTLEDEPYHFETPNYSGWLFERIVPSPYRKKRPNIMGVASRDSSITRAARNGWPVFVSGSGTANGGRYT